MDLCITVNKKSKDLIDNLLERAKVKSLKELTQHVFALFDLCLTCIEEGGKIKLEDKDGQSQEVDIFA